LSEALIQVKGSEVHDDAVRPLDSGLLQSALDACADPVEIVDAEGLIIFVNDAWSRMSGLRRQEVLGRKRTAVSRVAGAPAEPELVGPDMGVRAGATDAALSRRVFSPKEGDSECTVTIYERLDNRGLRVLVHRLANILTVIMTNVDLLERATGSTSQVTRVSLIRNAVAAGLDALESIRMQTGPDS
jgi:PAS domain-containing protein